MTTPPRMASLLTARTSLGVVVLGLALLGAWTASDVRGRPAAFAQKKPRVEEEEKPAKTPPKKKRVEEEEETPKAKPKRKVIRVEEEEGPKAKPGPARNDAPASGDLQQLAEQAKHRGAQTLFVDLAIPHDRVVFKGSQRVTIGSRPIGRENKDVEPIPVYLGKNPTSYEGKDLKLQPLANNGRREKPFSPTLTSIERVQPYEEIAQDEVRKFLKGPYATIPRDKDEHLSHFDMLVVAEQALAAVLNWHESARQTGQRSGKEWEAVESGLRERLLDVRLKQMDVLAKAGDWERALKLTRERLRTYTDKDHRERLSKPVAGMIEAALKGPIATEKQKKETRKRLRDLAAEFPDNPVFLRLGETLREQALQLLKQARDLDRDKNDAATQQRIQGLLQQAEEIWETRELRIYKLQRSEKYPVLRVGVRRLPKYLSPGWACTDTERRAVELLFESLVELIPDKKGIFRYRPGLAEQRPKVVPLGRHFQLPHNAKWSDGKSLNASDIRFTVDLLKSGRGLGRSRAWGELLDRVEVKNDPYQVTLRLHQGYLDPLALMTFKILPNHQRQRVDTEDFATNPVCSGPFRLDRSRNSDDNRECMFFVANPWYSSRRDVPRIQEVRFYAYNNAEEELRSGKLDLVLDLTAKEANELLQKAGDCHVEGATPATPNRRIYFLAINQSKLPDANLRKALAYAIDREKLLNDHFRGPLGPKVHKALNGPFPAGSWACNPDLVNRRKTSLDLHDEERARTLSKNATVGSLSLKYPADDPILEKALEDLRAQVKSTTGIALKLTPCDPVDLRQDVERTQNYELAYYHYDFPDETYWLGPLLGPRAAGGDSNIFNFTDTDEKPILSTLQTMTRHRDFAAVRENQRMVHRLLTEQMPFIPLWQLDPLLAYNRAVKPAALDPALVFTNIEEWHLKRE